jgi:hypothetical protein
VEFDGSLVYEEAADDDLADLLRQLPDSPLKGYE